MYLWMAVPDGDTSEGFATRLLEHGVLIAPGLFLGRSGEGYVRFALVPTIEECERAVEVLDAVL
jgi:acetylornithine aminotransferase